ncbi:MAG TPA: bifunctional transaldolase/phosoglucose isomerase [Rhizomicrobium sp.]|jgi:transaldolase/glucose-6-phosphate isomerase
MNRLKQLEQLGQSIWLDFLSREFLAGAEFKRLIDEDGLKGMTSNPSIFEKAIAHGKEYDADVARMVGDGLDLGTIFRKLSIADIRTAADAFRPVYDRLAGADGFISIEVSPYIAYDTDKTIAEAKSLWEEIKRPNLMVKVPATQEGLPAIRDLTGAGLNINITLLFSRQVYEQVAEAYIEGLEMRPKGEDLSRISSVASFFVSRIDTKADAAIDQRLKEGGDAALAELRGKVAVANAKLAYRQYKRIFSGPRWEALARRGARPQRLLWASTGTKNKAYSDVLYVDTLIGANTINTLPRETLEAFRDHGTPQLSIEKGLDEAERVLRTLESAGISLDRITAELVEEGVALFADAADKLFAALAEKRSKICGASLPTVSEKLGEAEQAVADEIKSRTARGDGRRLWGKDAALWTGADESRWLGWLDIAQRESEDLATYESFAQAVRATGWDDIVLLGMGGSSLGAEVLSRTLGSQSGWPKFHVLDSTDPEQIAALERRIVIAKTGFIVSSKSGTTLEPNILQDYFFDRVSTASSGGHAGKQFIAITDPGSALEKTAKKLDFAHIFHGDPEIGGRYSVLSKFGLIPAAAMGLDVARLCKETTRFILGCDSSVPVGSNPAMRLGIALGVPATKFGRDKITIVTSPRLASLGAWLEQLVAESTGKQGKGLIPVDGEALGDPSVYGRDRVFLNIQLAGDDSQAPKLNALEQAGHPVIRIAIGDAYQIGQVFYLCEMAIAAAGAVIGINPFDQPDVEAAKVKARELTEQFESGGGPEEKPVFARDGISLFADAANAAALGSAGSLAQYLKAHLSRLSPGDYFALLAFVEQSDESEKSLQGVRSKVRDRFKTATCVGFGPRFLHSTGQAYKGGPNTGVFLQVTCDHAHDLKIPGRKASFALVEHAQALGDFAVLNERGRRALRIHLEDLQNGLSKLSAAFDEALS